MAPTRYRPLAVAQLSSPANLSHSYPPPLQIFHRSSHLLSLCNFLIQNYQSSISIVLHLRPLIPNHSLFSLMTSVLFSPPQQPHLMNLLSPETLIFISIILQTHSPLSFCLVKPACNMTDLSVYRRNYQMIWMYLVLECCRWSFTLAIFEQLKK